MFEARIGKSWRRRVPFATGRPKEMKFILKSKTRHEAMVSWTMQWRLKGTSSMITPFLSTAGASTAFWIFTRIFLAERGGAGECQLKVEERRIKGVDDLQ